MGGRRHNTLRLVAGTWGGRRVAIAPRPGLRPTAERTRETLFNWLRAEVPGSRCLDLFAGSGALGLEAASRGAASVLLVERDGRAARHLRDVVDGLGGGDGVRIHRGDGLALLRGEATPQDIIFLDPPFQGGLLEPACTLLDRGGWLHPGSRIYLEHPTGSPPALPEGWARLRETRSGSATGVLLRPGN